MVYRDRKVVERKARLEAGYPTDGLEFGERVKKLRISKRWSQARLANEIRPRMSANYISDVERGKTSPKIESVRSIAVALGVDEIYLTYGYEPAAVQDVPVGPEPHDDIFHPEPNSNLNPCPKLVEAIAGEPDLKVKVEQDGAGVVLSIYLKK